MSSYEERKQARIERYLELAQKAERESRAAGQQASKMLEAIPLGQPLLVDHYSYSSDKRYRDRAWNKMGKSVELSQKADYYAARAEAAENNDAISSDDPDAITKLKEKLDSLIQSQEYMKQINAYYRRHGTCHGCEDLRDELADKIEADMQYHPWDQTPFPAYALSNNSSEIRRVRERIQLLEQIRDTGYVGWPFEGGRAEIDREGNRLQLFFDGKPPKEQRQQLRKAGFHWAPSEGAWQRQLKRTAFLAADALHFIYPSSGESPSALQPRPPKKEPEVMDTAPNAAESSQERGEMRPESGRISPAATVQDLLDELEAAYPQVFTSEGLPGYLDALARFSNYSYNNVLLISLGRPDAEHVEGFQTWKAQGRHVKRGEHGIKILAPCPIREHEDQERPAEPDQERKIIKTLFKVSTVFDVSQTEGEEPPKYDTGLSEAEIPLFQAALSQMLSPGHTYPLEDLRPAVEAAVRKRLEGGGHATDSGAFLAMDGVLPDLDFEASAAAYVICRRYGLPTPDLDTGAIQRRNWDTDSMKSALGCIRDTAVGLIESLDMKLYGQVMGRQKDAPQQANQKRHASRTRKKSSPYQGRGR